MTDFLKQNWTYLLGAALVHALFAAVFGLTMISFTRNAPPPVLAIQAVVVDQTMLGAGSRREKQDQARKEAAERERLAAEQRQKEEQQQQQEKQQQEAKQREQQAQRETEQRAEQERQVELKQRQEQDQRRTQEEQQLRDKQEVERKRAAEAQRQQQAEAERQRVADIERKQKEEAQRRKAADDAKLQAARENELKNQLAEEEGRTQAENAGLLNAYIGLIQQRVVRNWNRPPSAQAGLECRVKVAQTPAGVVLSVQVTDCNGDAAVKQSIEAAVMRSSPLPPPPDQRLFERNLLFVFKPAD
ncbi:MAG TPA: cell envelope integrity protein TolA [Steroidobacteraceae bacterium]|jgi:colicin import membrane protein